MHQTTAFTRVSLTSLYAQCSRAGTPISLYDERSKTKPSILRYLPLQQAPFYPRRLLSCPWMLWLFQVVCFRSLRVYHRRSKHKHKIIFFKELLCYMTNARYCALIVTIRFCATDFWVWGGILSLCCRFFKSEPNPHVWPFKTKLLNSTFLGSGVLFIMLFNEVLTFESVNEILKCTYSNKTELLSSTFMRCTFLLYKAVFQLFSM